MLLAVWTAILPATWGAFADPEMDPAIKVVHGFIVAVTATPLVFARLGRAALRLASTVASLLLLWAILPVGAWFIGGAAYLPAAVLLLAAGLADPQSRPQLTKALATAGVVVGVVVTVLWVGEVSRWWLRSHAACQGGYLTERLLTHEQFRVHLDRSIHNEYADPLFDQIGRLPGVEGVSYPYGQASTDPLSLGVSLREGSSAADKARLGSVCADCPGCRGSSSAATKPVIRSLARNRPGRYGYCTWLRGGHLGGP